MNETIINTPMLICNHSIKEIVLKRGKLYVPPEMETAAYSVLYDIAHGVTSKYRIVDKVKNVYSWVNR